MNKEIMRMIADTLENLPEHRFLMDRWTADIVYKSDDYRCEYEHQVNPKLWYDDCNTAGCIAGWTVALNKQNGVDPSEFHNEFGRATVREAAEEILGIDSWQGSRLFFTGYESVWWDLRGEFGLITACEKYHQEDDCCNDDGEFAECAENEQIADGQITPKMASEVLRRIANGEIIL